MKYQLDLFAEPAPPAGTIAPDANGFVPPAVLAPHFPSVATAEALSVTAYQGYAARSLMAFMEVVKGSDAPQLLAGHLYPVSYTTAARLVNEIVRGVASDRPAPTVESVTLAAERFPAWLLAESQKGNIK